MKPSQKHNYSKFSAEYKTIFLVTITDKITQKQDINLIKANLDSYKETINLLLKDSKPL